MFSNIGDIHINLHNQNLNELTFIPICRALAKIGTHIISLDLSFNPLFKDCCVTHLELVLKASPSLAYVTLEKTGISELGATTLIKCMSNMNAIKSLNMGSNKLSEKFFERLGSVFNEGKFMTMEALNLSNTKMSERSAVMLLVPLVENSNIEKLNLSMNCLRYKAASCLLTMLTTHPRSALKHADLTYNSISKSLLQAIEGELMKKQQDANKTLSDQVEISGINPICEISNGFRANGRAQKDNSGNELEILMDHMSGNKENVGFDKNIVRIRCTKPVIPDEKNVDLELGQYSPQNAPDPREEIETDAAVLQENKINEELEQINEECGPKFLRKKGSLPGEGNDPRARILKGKRSATPNEVGSQETEVLRVENENVGQRREKRSPLKSTATFINTEAEHEVDSGQPAVLREMQGYNNYENMREKILRSKNNAKELHPFYARQKKEGSTGSLVQSERSEEVQCSSKRKPQKVQTVILEELEEEPKKESFVGEDLELEVEAQTTPPEYIIISV